LKAFAPIREFYSEFSAKERKVCQYIVRGHDNKTIAKYLGTTEQTVKNMVSRMYDKVGCSNRVEFVLMTARSDEERRADLEMEKLETEQRLKAINRRIDMLERKTL
jgi:DNA-binding NarL/FixJ family response regulator